MRSRKALNVAGTCLTLHIVAVQICRGQYMLGTSQFREQLGNASGAATDMLKDKLLELQRVKTDYVRTDLYREEAPEGYVVNLILDPCRGNAYNCCMDSFGYSEYLMKVTTEPDGSLGMASADDDTILRYGKLVREDLSAVSIANSRRPNDEMAIDITCHGSQYPRPDCVANRFKEQPGQFPACWDNNATVVADENCTDPYGVVKPLCFGVGYTSNAYIVTCGKHFANDPHCGTFLEVHLPADTRYIGRWEVLTDTKLVNQTSGYRTTIISSTVKGNSSRVLCKGAYELWWVQRTRSEYIIQKKKKFRVVSPPCTYDDTWGMYFPYYEIER